MKPNKKQIKELNRIELNRIELNLAKAISTILHLQDENNVQQIIDAITYIFNAIHCLDDKTSEQDAIDVYNMVQQLELIQMPASVYKS